MHQEISRREKLSVIRLGVIILFTAVVLTTFNTLLVNYHLNSSWTDVVIIGLIIFLAVYLVKRNMTSYKYCLIDNELIIWEIVGSKEKRILNMHLNEVVKFSRVRDKSYDKDKQLQVVSRKKLYNCMNIHNRHYIIYDHDDGRHWITIQPSDCMINLIKDRVQQDK